VPRLFRDSRIVKVDSYDAFKEALEVDGKGNFLLAHWDGTPETEKRIKDETRATIRCIPFEGSEEPGRCILTGRPSKRARGVRSGVLRRSSVGDALGDGAQILGNHASREIPTNPSINLPSGVKVTFISNGPRSQSTLKPSRREADALRSARGQRRCRAS